MYALVYMLIIKALAKTDCYLPLLSVSGFASAVIGKAICTVKTTKWLSVDIHRMHLQIIKM